MVMTSVGAEARVMEQLQDFSRTLRFCSDDVRYDLQRNLIQTIEQIIRENPNGVGYFKAVREVADSVVDDYKGRGQVHVALRRIADKNSLQADQASNVLSFGSLRKTFQRHAEADKFLLDRMLAKRNDAGELKLSPWGEFVLSHLDKKQRIALKRQSVEPHISPI